MPTISLSELYERHIKILSPEERLRLLALVAQDLAAPSPGATETSENSRRSIMELHGLGKEIWEGIDAQQYVNELRAEWDHRP